MNAKRTRKTKTSTSSASTRSRKGPAAARKTKGAQSRGAVARRKSNASARGGASSRKTAAPKRGGPAAKSSSRSASRGSRSPIGQAIEMLSADHRMVQQMFGQGERAKKNPQRLQQIVEAACAALTLHAEIEEQYLYPQMRATGKDTDMIAEAYIEHASAKQLIAELEGGDPGEEEYAAKFKVLGEYVKHHVKEEEGEIFPKARRARADFAPLLEALVARDEAVLAEGASDTRGRSASPRRRSAAQPSQAGATGASGAKSTQGTRSSRGASDADEADTTPDQRAGARGRSGRGRAGPEATAADEGTQAANDAGEERAGGDATTADLEQPRRARRGKATDADVETGSQGRESESEEQEERGTRQGR